MFEDPVPNEVRQALINRFEGYEIVELLDISPEDVIDAFADIISDNLDKVKDEIGMIDDPLDEACEDTD